MEIRKPHPGVLLAGKPELKVEKIGPVYYLTNTCRGVKTWFCDFTDWRMLIFHEDFKQALWFAEEEQAARLIPHPNRKHFDVINIFSKPRRLKDLAEGKRL